MGALAERLGGDRTVWSQAGLLHDLDYSETLDDPARHGLLAAEELRPLGVAGEILDAIASHAGHRDRTTLLDRALFAADPVTGLVTACALVMPGKTLAAVTAEMVARRFKEKGFARGARREQIAACSEVGMELPEFLALALAAMQGIAGELGL